VPQLQAIREVFLEVGKEVPLIADGGVKNDKDIFLAIACGASSVMLGAGLSGTDESPGMMVTDPATNQKMKIYRGMTSPEAVADGMNIERVSEALRTPAEGQSVRVPYIGSAVDVIERIRGHLQSSVSYAGQRSLADAHQKISSTPEDYLIPLSSASRRESFER
jgi:IMP dehydrogenase/GMP reductase